MYRKNKNQNQLVLSKMDRNERTHTPLPPWEKGDLLQSMNPQGGYMSNVIVEKEEL
jgi:hypothetical protein